MNVFLNSFSFFVIPCLSCILFVLVSNASSVLGLTKSFVLVHQVLVHPQLRTKQTIYLIDAIMDANPPIQMIHCDLSILILCFVTL